MKSKTYTEILTSPEAIEEFFKAVGREDLADGFDVRSSKSFTINEKRRGKKHLQLKSSRKKLFAPAKSDRYIDGYATTPDVDWVKDSVSLDAMKEAEGHLLRQGTNTVFLNHDTDKPIGKVMGVKVDKKGMFVQIIISKAKDVDDIWTKIKEGILSSYSIRFIAKKVKVERDEDYNVLNYSIEKMEMLEVSVVGLPMNKEANIVNVRGKSIKPIKSLLKQKGVKDMKSEKKETITEVVKELLPELLGDALDSKLDSFAKKLEGKFEVKPQEPTPEEKAKALEEENAKLKEELAKSKKSDDTEEGDDSDDDKQKALEEENEKLKKQLEDAKAEKGSKKGADNNDDEEEGGDDDGETKKSLKNIEDEDTCKFVLHAMDNEDVYDGLTASEQKKVRHLWFQMAKEVKNSK